MLNYGGLSISLTEYESLSFRRRDCLLKRFFEQKDKENKKLKK